MEKKRDFVLLCYSRNTPYSYDSHAPVPILALGTFLEQNGVDIEYFDERIDSESRFDALAARRPLLAGFSVIGGYQIASAARLSRKMRELSEETKIVWGGICPTTLPEDTLREDYVDYVALGEGEETLLELYRSLKEGGDGRSVAGLAKNAPRPPMDIEAIPFVYQGKAVEMLQRHLAHGTIREAVGYEASRGCPFLCTFCYSPNFHGRQRVKSLEKVDKELAKMKELGVDDLEIYDDTLYGGRVRDFPAFFDLLKRDGYAWIGNFRINILNEDLLRRMEDSGCKFVYFGIESNDDAVLKTIKKGFTAADIRDGIRLMKTSRLPTVYSIIYGMPLDGEKDKVDRCLDFASEIHAQHPSAEVQIQSYVPLPGSDLFDNAVRFGFKPPRRLEGWVDIDHFEISNPWLDDQALANKFYITSFLAFRYRRHLSHFPVNVFAYPLHKFSLWRIRTHTFGFYFEKFLYDCVLKVSESLTHLYFKFQNITGSASGPRSKGSCAG